MKNLCNIARMVWCEPWLIRPEMHATIAAIVESHIAGTVDHAAVLDEFMDQPEVKPTVDGPIAILPMHGVMGKRIGALEKMSGMMDVDDMAAMLDWAAGDPEIKGVMLDIRSPGGTVTGVPELAAQVRAMGKPVWAHTDEMAASAAYWVGSQAQYFGASPSAVLGSVGVYLPVLDQSQRFAQAGLRQEVIKAGKFKGAGIPGTALTDDQRARLQDRVDFLHTEFKHAVQSARPAVSDDSMQGQDFFAMEAQAAGMVDEIMGMREMMDVFKKWAGKR